MHAECAPPVLYCQFLGVQGATTLQIHANCQCHTDFVCAHVLLRRVHLLCCVLWTAKCTLMSTHVVYCCSLEIELKQVQAKGAQDLAVSQVGLHHPMCCFHGLTVKLHSYVALAETLLVDPLQHSFINAHMPNVHSRSLADVSNWSVHCLQDCFPYT